MKKMVLVLVGLMGVVTLALFVIPRISQDQASSNLVAVYHFDEGQGETAFDSSGHKLNGSLFGPNWTEGRYNHALNFHPGSDPARDYVTIDDHDLLDLGSSYTLMAWIKLDSYWSGDERMEVLEKGGSYWINIRNESSPPGKVRSGGVYGGCRGPGTDYDGDWVFFDSIGEVPLDSWTHVATTYDGSKIRTYIDGLFSGSTNATGSPCANDTQLVIGAKHITRTTEALMDGVIDEVYVFSKAMNRDEIIEVMNNSEDPPDPDPPDPDPPDPDPPDPDPPDPDPPDPDPPDPDPPPIQECTGDDCWVYDNDEGICKNVTDKSAYTIDCSNWSETVTVKKGWNLISLPEDMTFSTSHWFLKQSNSAGIAISRTSIWTPDGKFESSIYKDHEFYGYPVSTSPDAPMFVLSGQDTQLDKMYYPKGSASSSLSLGAGFNAIVLRKKHIDTGMTSREFLETKLPVLAGTNYANRQIMQFNSETQRWEAHIYKGGRLYGSEFTVAPNNPYFILLGN